ncbi:hypothetical protein JCM21900_005630 [Sporobolomyces salmonicolor]
MIGADEIRECSRRCAEAIKKEKEQHSHVVRVIERRHSLDSTAGCPAPAEVQRINPHGGKRSSSFRDYPGNSMKLAPPKSALASDTKIQLYPAPTLRSLSSDPAVVAADTFPIYHLNKSRPSTSGEEYGDRLPGPPGRDDTISFEFDDFF